MTGHVLSVADRSTERRLRPRTSDWIVALLVLAGAALLFSSGVLDILRRWSREPEWNHGFLSAAVIAFQIWRHRYDWGALAYRPNAAGPILIAIAAVMALCGDLSATFFLSQYGLVLALAGLVLALWGIAGLRLAAMPLLLLAVVVPMPYFVETSLSLRLQLLSSDAGVAILQMLGIAAHNDGNVIDLGPFQLDVAEACSGLRYLFPLIGLSVIVASLYRGPLVPKLLAIVAAPPIAVAMNVLRIAFVGILVNARGIAAAEGFLHLFEGWAIFLLCALLLVAVLAIANRFVSPCAGLLDRFGLAPPRHRRPVAAAARAFPRTLAAAAAILVIAGATTAALRLRADRTPPHPPLVTFPLQIGAWRGTTLALPPDQASVLGHPDYTLATYTRPDGAIANLFVAYYARQEQGTAVHSPRACLPGGGWHVVSSRVIEVAVPGGRVPMNRVVIERDRARQIVYYGFDQRGRWLTNEYAVKALVLWDAVIRNRTDGALVRIVGPVAPGMTETQADRRIAALLTESYRTIVQFVPD